MTIPSDSPDYPEYERTFHDLVMGMAEQTRREHEELIEHGFTIRQVVGSPSLMYERDGKLHTREAAVATTWVIREQKRKEDT